MRPLRLNGYELPPWVKSIAAKETACKYCGARIHWAHTKRQDGSEGRAPMALVTFPCECAERPSLLECKRCGGSGSVTEWQAHHVLCPHARQATRDARRKRGTST